MIERIKSALGEAEPEIEPEPEPEPVSRERPPDPYGEHDSAVIEAYRAGEEEPEPEIEPEPAIEVIEEPDEPDEVIEESESDGESEPMDLADVLAEWLIGSLVLAVGLSLGLLIVYYGSRVGFTGPVMGAIVVAGLTLPFGIGRLARVLVGRVVGRGDLG